jgi:hypothetical protein
MASRFIFSAPTKKSSAIYPKGVGHLANSHPTFYGFHCTNPNIEGRVPSMAHDQKEPDALAARQPQTLQFFCDGPYGEIKPLSLRGVAVGITQLATYEAMYGVGGRPGITGLRYNHET